MNSLFSGGEPVIQWKHLFRVIVPAVPVAQPRVKATAFGGRVRVFTPTKVTKSDGSKEDHPIAAFKATVRMSVKEAYDGPVLQGAIRVDLAFILPRPQSLVWKTRPMPRIPHVKKPDRDNLDKAVLDALSGRLIGDDCQVACGVLEKWIAAGGEQPHVEMNVYLWPET